MKKTFKLEDVKIQSFITNLNHAKPFLGGHAKTGQGCGLPTNTFCGTDDLECPAPFTPANGCPFTG